jgi:hypothetical protein
MLTKTRQLRSSLHVRVFVCEDVLLYVSLSMCVCMGVRAKVRAYV